MIRYYDRFPRTYREVFGCDMEQLSTRITFLNRQRAGWPALVAAVALLFFIWSMK